MLDTASEKEKDEPPSRMGNAPASQRTNGLQTNSRLTSSTESDSENKGFFGRLFNGQKKNDSASLREAIEDYIIEVENGDLTADAAFAHERALLSNILSLRENSVSEIMIPRADIVAIDVTTSQSELLNLLSEKQNSRIPVYKDTLDEVLGTIHIKDILASLAQGREIDIEDLLRHVPIISPAMSVLDLLMMFREMKKHMALVVDEFGGIDGLITVGDVLESIVGEIDDEYDLETDPSMSENKDGSISADARIDIDEFEEKYGEIFTEEERECIDTLGGLVFALAGRIPARGEIIVHPNGMIFEVIDADPRRVNRLLIKKMPKSKDSDNFS